jgi:hypothetical protein
MSCRCDHPVWLTDTEGFTICKQCGNSHRPGQGSISVSWVPPQVQQDINEIAKRSREVLQELPYIGAHHDPVNAPKHYMSHPSGVECIQITEHMGFNLGNAVKYIWRADLKHDAIEDLKKAAWYLEREIKKRAK